MRNRLDDVKRIFAVQIYQFGIFKDKTKSPGGKGFRLRLHQSKPDAPLSPYYIDMGLLRSYPSTVKATGIDLFKLMALELPGDVLADVPTSITPIVSSLSDYTQIPMITPRAPKDHGTGGSIDGIWPKGACALLFDDLITEGHSTLEASKTLRDHGMLVEDIVVFLDREQGGKERLAAEGLSLHAAFTISELLRLYRDTGTIDMDLYDEIQAYRAVM